MPLRDLLPFRFGIRARMLALVLAVGTPFLLFLAAQAHRQAEQDEQHARDRLRAAAMIASGRLDAHVRDIGRYLETLAATLPFDPDRPAVNDAHLRAVAARRPLNIAEVSLWSAEGRNIGSSTSGDSPDPRPNALDRGFLLSALRDDRLHAEAPLRHRKDGEWLGVFALRIERPGQAPVVVSASTRLATLALQLDPDGRLPDGAVVSISNGEARVVARSLDAGRWIGQAAGVDRTVALRRLAEGVGTTAARGLDGVPRLLGYSRARDVPWLVLVGLPAELAAGPSQRARRETLTLGIGLLLGGLAWAVWIARGVARPLRELAADARLMGEGRSGHRTQVRGASEIGGIGAILNRMAAALEERRGAFRRQEERLRLALESSEQALFDWDIASDRIHYSARASTLRGGPAVETEVTAQSMRQHVHPDDLPVLHAATRDALTGTRPLYEAEFRVRHRDGHWVWLRSRGRVVERDGDGRALRLIGTHADITRRKAAEESLRLRAERDVLTGLPNRALFFDRLEGAIARARRTGRPLALLYLDVDRFKSINDSLGHAAGDQLLRTTAERMLATVRGVDTVARLAGDEFTVIIEGLAERADAAAVGEKLVEAMRAPVSLGGRLVSVSTSVGIAILESDDADAAGLVKRADDALYEAKRSGRDRYSMGRAVTG